MESDTMELLRLMLAHLRPRLQGRDEELLVEALISIVESKYFFR